MKRLSVGLAVAAITSFACLATQHASAEFIQWKVEDGGNGHWYEAVYVPGGLNGDGATYWGGIDWPDARDAAIAMGGWLADIRSAEENAFAYALVTADMWRTEPSTHAKIGPWLGGYQPPGSNENAGNWRWLPNGDQFMDDNGTAIGYTNWNPSEPTNGYLGPGGYAPEDALQFYLGYPGKWNDYPSWATTLGYMVESNTNPTVPEPSILLVWSGLAAMGLIAVWRRRRRAA